MKCQAVQKLFSPYLDGELTPAEKNRLEQHIGRCPQCRRELSRWRELSRALQDLAIPVKPPPELAETVISQVAAQKQVQPQAPKMRRWVAAAAAIVILAAGTITYASQGLWPHMPLLAGNLSGQQTEINRPPTKADPASKGEKPGSDKPGITNEQNPAGDKQPEQTEPQETVPENNMPDPEPNIGENNLPSEPEQQTKPPVQVANTETYPAQTFLNNNHQTSSTLLKLAVGDLASAKATVIDLAANNGASLQVIAEQSSGPEKRFIYQITVDNQQAKPLLTSLYKVGTINSENVNTQDLSQKFATTLGQYQNKVAQANNTDDPKEKTKFSQEAKVLEQQLLTWERESKQQTIVLWLEAR